MTPNEQLPTSVGDGHDRAMLSAAEIAEQLGCSERHIRRLADSGQMPRPIKLGSLSRFRRTVIEQWIEDGCPRIRQVSKGGGQ